MTDEDTNYITYKMIAKSSIKNRKEIINNNKPYVISFELKLKK